MIAVGDAGDAPLIQQLDGKQRTRRDVVRRNAAGAAGAVRRAEVRHPNRPADALDAVRIAEHCVGWYIAVCCISLSPGTRRSVFNQGQTVTARGAVVDRNHAVAADDEAGIADAPQVGLAELTGRAALAVDAGRDLDPRS